MIAAADAVTEASPEQTTGHVLMWSVCQLLGGAMVQGLVEGLRGRPQLTCCLCIWGTGRASDALMEISPCSAPTDKAPWPNKVPYL